MITFGGIWVVCGLIGAGIIVEKTNQKGWDVVTLVGLGLIFGPMLLGSAIGKNRKRP